MRVVILGAGIAGLSTAAALRRVGIESEIWERSAELRPIGAGIGIANNATTALKVLDIDIGLGKTRGAGVSRMQILSPKGRRLLETPVAEIQREIGTPAVTVHRADLQAGLIEAIEDTPIHLGAAATAFRPAEAIPSNDAGTGVCVEFADGRTTTGDLLVGADGINSVVRRELHGGEGRIRYGGFVAWLATIEYANPLITPGWNAQYWGRGRRFGLHDIGRGRVYWWGTMTMPEARASAWDGDKAEIARAFKSWAPVISELIEITPFEQIVAVPARDRPFDERWGDGPVTLIGDAAHPMLTSLSQGGSTAIEEAVVLAKVLESAADPVRGLREWELLRRERTRMMVDVSYQMRTVEQVDNRLMVMARALMLKYGSSRRVANLFHEAMVMPPIPAKASRP
jgi:2-polyprenyl-6-methoxyphenol hydroxylase-like FAD-dependent oxidoreductase